MFCYPGTTWDLTTRIFSNDDAIVHMMVPNFEFLCGRKISLHFLIDNITATSFVSIYNFIGKVVLYLSAVELYVLVYSVVTKCYI